MIGVACTWVYLIWSMMMSFTHTPHLTDFEFRKHSTPKVSIIVPARNEEGYVKKCLESLTAQDYENYEVIAVNDSSEDSTGQIIDEFAKKSPKIISVTAGPKPDGWMGKNWACMEGFKKASGDLLLFTDADTHHKPCMLSLSVSYLLLNGLDALTVIPRLLALDWWTRVTLPMISTFLHTQFSALKVNDPKKKTGYFFGSFFIIKKETYQQVGMHKGVRGEIIEDGALGNKVKAGGHSMMMVRGEDLLDAIWARDRSTLWDALKRLMVPLYLQSGKMALGIFTAVLFLLFMPFILLGYSTVLLVASHTVFPAWSGMILFTTSLVASAMICVGDAVEVRKGLFLRRVYLLFAPVGGLVVVLGFLSGLLHAKSDSAVSWRGRSYSMKDHAQNSVHI